MIDRLSTSLLYRPVEFSEVVSWRMPRPKRQKTDHAENNHIMGSSHAWADLTAQLEQAIPKANEIAKKDGQLNAFTTTNAVKESTVFGIKAAGSDNTITATVNNGTCKIGTGKASDCAFVLSALPEVSFSIASCRLLHSAPLSPCNSVLTPSTAMAGVLQTDASSRKLNPSRTAMIVVRD